MTDTVSALSTLRAAHGQLVASLLAGSAGASMQLALVVTRLACFNRLAADQIAALHARGTTMRGQPARSQLPPTDMARLLTELAASCADLGAVVRNLPPGAAWDEVEATLRSVIGHYRTTILLLHGGARA